MDYLEIRELYHHGIKGQKWGIRRYQNDDGSYTPEGKKRYGIDKYGNMTDSGRKLYKQDRKESVDLAEKDIKEYNKDHKKLSRKEKGKVAIDIVQNKYGKLTLDDLRKRNNKRTAKKVAGAAGGVIGASTLAMSALVLAWMAGIAQIGMAIKGMV